MTAAAAAASTYPVHFLDESTCLPLCRSETARKMWNWTREPTAVTCPECKKILEAEKRS